MNWDTGRHTMTDEDIRQMPEALRERIAMYQEQRREGQQIMHQLANPPQEEEGMGTAPERPSVQTHLAVIAFQLLIVIVILSIIAAELK